MPTEPDEPMRHKLLEQIVDALQYCHRKGVVHGNLSPQTVMITHQEHDAKLVAFACQGKPQDDIRAMGDIIDTLQLPAFKPLAERCRGGQISSMDEMLKALRQPKPHRWWPKALMLVALLAIVAAGAFWAGHCMSLARDQRQADSLPLPGIYFNDTVNMAANGIVNLALYRSTLTGAPMYMDDKNPDHGYIPENVAVDLGLSVLWAPFNVGSGDANVSHLGAHFTWCDTLGIGINQPLDKCWPQNRAMIDISGTEYDCVGRIWGGRWRMPTFSEWQDMVIKCKWTLVLERGLPPGYKVHGPNGTEIFLPLAGYGLRHRAYDIGESGRYWSSTPVTGADRQAHALRLDTAKVDFEAVSLIHSLSIRPVLDKK